MLTDANAEAIQADQLMRVSVSIIIVWYRYMYIHL